MSSSNGYAVFFFPPALEALGDAIKPYLQDSPAGPHVLCNEIDTGGALLEMTIQGVTKDGGSVVLDLMVPTSMVRMIVSSQSDATFGFGPRVAEAVVSIPMVGVGVPVDSNDVGGATPGKGKAKTKKAAAKPAKGKPKAGSKSSKSKPSKIKPVKSKPVKSKPAKSRQAKSKPTKSKPAKNAPEKSKPARPKRKSGR